MEKINLADEGNWIRENRDQPSLKEMLTLYVKENNIPQTEEIDLMEALSWWKKKKTENEAKQEGNK